MKYILIFLSMAMSSCCIYHETKINQDQKIKEFGIAPYSNRPLIQDQCQI